VLAAGAWPACRSRRTGIRVALRADAGYLAGQLARAARGEHIAVGARRSAPLEAAVTSTRYRAPLTDTDRLVLAARFETYLTWRHAGDPAPRSARETAERIGWQAHTVAKRCENIRARYARLGVPGLGGPRALEQLALLLVSTGELTAADLQLLPAKASSG